MSLIGTIANNPDAAAIIGLAASALGKVLWNRGKKSKEEDLWETLLKVGKQCFPLLLRDKRLYDDDHVRTAIHDTITKALKRLSIPMTEVVLKLVDEATEHVKAELAEMVFKYHAGHLEKPLQSTLDAIKSLPQEVPIGVEGT